VDPARLKPNLREPKVFIENLFVDEVEAELNSGIEIPAGSHRITVTYAALSLRYPKGVRYRYMIKNFDRDWITAETDRQAVYTNLPPGSYTFTVIACNNDGVWNMKGASLSFIVKPYYYQTIWFYLLAAIALTGSIFMYTQFRTSRMKKRAKALENLVETRTREIASHRDDLVALNEELRSSQEEVMAQRDSLSEKNDEIAGMNTNLEKIVAERTRVLEEQNKRLAEYAFINAHKLRAPLASILGIIHLLTIETDKVEQRKLLDLLNTSSAELDEIVHSINKMLEEGLDSNEEE
jgi:signal transduction histidine kinase